MEEKRRDGGLPPNAAGGTPDFPNDTAPSRRRGGALKRKASAAPASSFSSTPSKRLAREKSGLVSQTPIHNGPLTRARHAPSNLAYVMTRPDPESRPDGEDLCVKPTDGAKHAETDTLSKAGEEWEALEPKIEAEFQAIRSRGTNAHVVPYHCGWFSWSKVHPIEKGSLPSFFDGKHEGWNPDLYMKIRNWIMKKYHVNPSHQIESACLSELDAGDTDSKQEVMEFLEYWGLINFHPFPLSEAPSISLSGSKAEEEEKLDDKLYHFEAIQPCPSLAPEPHLMTEATPSRLFQESALSDELLKLEGPAVEYHCNSCSADCSRKRYHCQKQADFDLCTDCFNNKKFGSNMSSSDFILMEPAEAPGIGSGKWTDQETLLLLEALELYRENWSEIAEHVATKSKAQCILHFVQMPIEDAFHDHDVKDIPLNLTAEPAATSDTKSDPRNTEAAEHKNGAGNLLPQVSATEKSKPEDPNDLKSSQEAPKFEDDANSMKVDKRSPESDATCQGKCGDEDDNIALKALQDAFEDIGYPLTPENTFSFADAGNPVMALAAFLARLVGSNVATASSHAALKSISGDSPGLQLASRHCFLIEDPLEDNKEPPTPRSPSSAKRDEKSGEKIQKENVSSSETDECNTSTDFICKDEDKKSLGSPTDKSKVGVTQELGNSDATKGIHTSSPKDPGDMMKSRKNDPNDISSNSGQEKNASPDSVPTRNSECAQPPICQSVQDVSISEGSRDAKMEDIVPPENETAEPYATREANSQPQAISKDDIEHDTSTGEHHINSTSVNEIGEEQNKDGNMDEHVCEGTESVCNERVKRAAISALIGATVKAKVLAKQEEDQIRQLAVSLIEKQLYKLETKLAFFSEMDGVLMRAREQLDRSKLRLFQERQQIIASRLGFSPSSSKILGQTNRIATNFAHSISRPPIWMTTLRPSIPRALGTVAATSAQLASTVGPGAPTPPSGSETASSWVQNN